MSEIKNKFILKNNNPYEWIFRLFTAIVGYEINNKSIFWAIIDFLFYPIAWIKWIICHEVNISIIKKALAPFI
jgi:hypothetical protein